MFYTAKIPWIIKKMFPSLVFKFNDKEKTIYLTFDDGPIPETTPLILDILEKYNAKATFFCLGKNVEKHPELFDLIIQRGHTTGNHGYSHKNGWKTANAEYFEDIEKANKLIRSDLFRPPYGRIKPSQIKYLKKKYRIVMWDVLSGDFDYYTDSEKCYKNVINNVENGSVVVFHDSLKAKNNVLEVLPEVLEKLKAIGLKVQCL
jgi:peptidoglycan/xylan/chitin deacetylase (PgdA/CDA1 family)